MTSFQSLCESTWEYSYHHHHHHHHHRLLRQIYGFSNPYHQTITKLRIGTLQTIEWARINFECNFYTVITNSTNMLINCKNIKPNQSYQPSLLSTYFLYLSKSCQKRNPLFPCFFLLVSKKTINVTLGIKVTPIYGSSRCLPGRPIILLFWPPAPFPIPSGTHKIQGVEKFGDFQLKSPSYAIMLWRHIPAQLR